MNQSTSPTATGDYEEFWTRFQDSARYHPANRYRYALITERVVRYLASGTKVLDIGCGEASLLKHLHAAAPQGEYFGCDVSHRVIDLDSNARGASIQFFQADVCSDAFSDTAKTAAGGEYDIVVSSEVIEHVENDGALLRNAAKVLKPGGYFLLTTQSGPRYRIDLELLHHLRHYRRADLKAAIRAAGLEVVESFNCGFPILNLQKIVANALFDTVMRTTASSTKPPFVVRRIMDVMYYLMRYSPKVSGPQLVLVARRPA
jgi:2-polyprenyl-3-methyl-5-hydroxy-6-metoxy-1,4-benzoquinol methylase